MAPDDMRIPDSFHLAEEKGIEFSFEEANLKEAHPNSAELELEGVSGRSLTVVGESWVAHGLILRRLMGSMLIFPAVIQPWLSTMTISRDMWRM